MGKCITLIMDPALLIWYQSHWHQFFRLANNNKICTADGTDPMFLCIWYWWYWSGTGGTGLVLVVLVVLLI